MLTTKQELFTKNLLSGESAKQSAINAGYSPRSAESIASENLRKPNIQERINLILEEAGLTDEQLAKKLKHSINSGLGVKPTNSDAIKGIRLAYELKNLINNKNPNFQQSTNIQLKFEQMPINDIVQELGMMFEKFKDYKQYVN